MSPSLRPALASSAVLLRPGPRSARGALWLGLVLATLGAACSSGGGSSGGSGGSGGSGSAVTTALFGVIKDTSGVPVAGAKVQAGGVTATTDAGGKFQMAAGAGPAVVRVEAAGFAPTSLRVEVHGGHASAVNVRLLRETPPVPLDATAGGVVQGPRGATLEAPAGAFVDPSGKGVSGEVQVSLTPLDPSDRAQRGAAPGDFSARSAGGAVVMLESFGMMDISVRQGDVALNIAPGKAVKVRIPAPASGETPATMPLWSFDLATGQWVEEGTVALDAEARVYEASLPHLSYWNADLPLEATCITGVVKDTGGAVLPGARVNAQGVDYTGDSSATAGVDGRFYLAVRRSSQVDVLAIHQDGGGQERRVQSGAEGTNVPPTPGDPRCLDVGEWAVQKGTVSLVGKGPVSCNGYANPLATCQPGVMPLFDCFKPEGACKQKNVFEVEYANGAALKTDINAGSSSVVQTYLGPGGVLCGTATTQVGASSGEATSAVITYKLPGGAEVAVPVTTYGDGERFEMTCQNGSKFDLQGEELRQWEACSGGSGGDECEQPAGLPNGSACTLNSECREGALCCDFGPAGKLCQSESLCIGGDACQVDADCKDASLICCIEPQLGGNAYGGNRCQTEAACYSNGKCKTDAQCQAGESCCGGLCEQKPTCDGECSVDGDCGGAGKVCCGTSPDRFCSEAELCYGGQLCNSDGDCGGGLRCCGAEGDKTCKTEQACFEGKLCQQSSECGPLDCCESPFAPGTKTCATAAGCLTGKPCQADAECPAPGFTCCEGLGGSGPICAEALTCYLGQPCEQASDCKAPGLTCCNLEGSGQFCLEQSGCPN